MVGEGGGTAKVGRRMEGVGTVKVGRGTGGSGDGESGVGGWGEWGRWRVGKDGSGECGELWEVRRVDGGVWWVGERGMSIEEGFIQKKEKAKFVTAAWGTELIQFVVVQAI